MKVQQNSRGGKKGAPRGRGREQRKTFEKTDLVVTVTNEESGASRIKPPVNATQSRKIVRLSQNKTESTDLEKVTVKSLDEIKREKEQRQRESSIRSSQSASQPTPASQIPNGGAGTSKDINHQDLSSKPLKSNSEPVRHHGPVIATSQTDVASASAIKAKLPLKKLTIPLKALPALSPSHCRILHPKPPSATVSRTPDTHEVSMDFDSGLPEQDFDYIDGDDEESDSDNDLDEDFLLRDHESEMGTNDDPKRAGSQNCDNSNDLSASYDGILGYTDTSDEREDDEISLHPDDSLFDEEDDSTPNNDRLRPRSLGRRSGSESRDLRAKMSERQKQSQDSSNSTVKRTDGEPHPDTEDQKVDMSNNKEKADNAAQRSDHRGRNFRNSARRGSSRAQEERRGPKNLTNAGGRRGGRGGRGHVRNDASRRGRGSRQSPRKASGPTVVPNLIRLPPIFGTGDGLLPFPGAPDVGLHVVSSLQAALAAKIQNNIKTTVNMLTNPPPVPGEVVTNFEASQRQPPRPYTRATQGNQSNIKMGSQQPINRQQSSPADAANIKPLMEFPVPASSPQKPVREEKIPTWLQKTYQGNENSEQGMTSQCSQGNAGDVAPSNDRIDVDSRPPRPVQSLPNSDDNIEMQPSTSKRKSPFHGEEMAHGGKIVVGTSPEGLPQPNPVRMQHTYPKALCPEQLQTGGCKTKSCLFWHLTKTELEEYKRSQQSGHVNSQGHLLEGHSEQQQQGHLLEGQIEQQHPVVQQQKKVDVAQASYELVSELLRNGKLGAAWQMIERLGRMNQPPDLSVLQHVLFLCSKHLQEPDVAAQVACKAFDTIGRMVVQHNRHSYETLIKTLCHSGQYIRAYEMLDLMKKNNHAPTYEVFLDLVQASSRDPDWAFNLKDEIKRSGVFKSKICSDLILLGCNSGEYFVERTWLLFQEALENQVQVTPEAVSRLLFTLLQAEDWEKIMSLLPSVPESVPIEILKSAVLNACKRVDWIEAVIAVLAMTPAEKLCQLGADMWNAFFSNCCLAHGNNASFAQKVYSLMQENGIPLPPESINSYMSALSLGNNWAAALELFTTARTDPRVLEHPQTLESGLIALSTALGKAGTSDGMLRVVHFMLEHHIKPEDSVIQSAVDCLDKEKNYKGVHQFFQQLEAAAIVPPMAVYREMVSSLEKWTENPTASCEVYYSMRQAYSSSQADSGAKKEVVSSSEKNEQPGKQVCRFFGTPRGCFSGDNCKFLHPVAAVSSCEGPQHLSLPPKDTFPSGDVHMAQESGHGSGAGGMSGVNTTGSTNEKRPPNLFIPQAHGAQQSGISASTSEVASSQNWVEDPAASCEPYAPMQLPYSAGQSITDNKNEAFSNGKKTEQPDKPVCRYFGTPRGCFSGEKCRFLHPGSAVSSHKGSQPVSLLSKDNFPAANVNVVPEPGRVSRAGSTSGGGATGSINEKRPSNPFVLQAQGTQQSGIPASANQIASSENWVEDPAASCEPYVPMQLPYSASQSVTDNKNEAFRDSEKISVPGKQVCRFFGTLRGCFSGDNCKFLHPGRDVSSHERYPASQTPQDHFPPADAPVNQESGLVSRVGSTSGCSATGSISEKRPSNPFVLHGVQHSGIPVSQPFEAHQISHSGMESSPFVLQTGSVNPVPFMEARNSGSSQQQPPFRPVDACGFHFHHAGGTHFKAANPFSPNLPGRTRSLEGVSEQKSAGQIRQAHSAPVVPEMPGTSLFNYPSKKNIKFYEPRIKHASQHNRWEDLGYVYINMKNEDVEMDYGVLEVFFQAFEAFSPDTIGESFDTFTSKVTNCVEEGMPEADPDRSPSSSLDEFDKQFIGQLGVALMYFCYSKKCFTQGYNVLHVLHNLGINYALYSGEFGVQRRPLTTTEVSLTAADICLNLDEPVYTSALEVLRGTNYGRPANDSGTLLTAREAEWRRHVWQSLCKNFMNQKEFDLVHELLSEVGEIDVFGRRELKALYNELLVALINNNELNIVSDVLKTMDANFISRDADTIRALVKGYGEAGRIRQAKQHFSSGCISGVYPKSFNQDNPWTVVIGTSFSALESQLYVENHLGELYRFIEQLAHQSGDRVLDDTYHRPLKVVVKSDEVQNTGSKYMRREEIIRCVREMLCTVLTDDFNPPLSCKLQSKDEEVIVDALSLKRWFCANAASGRSKRVGSFSVATSSANTARSHPYLQPGMSNVVSSDGQEREGRRVVVSETEAATGLSSVQGNQQLQHLPFLIPHGQHGT